MSSRVAVFVGAALAIAGIVVITLTTSGVPRSVAPIVFVALVGLVVFNERRTRALGVTVLDALRAKGPMTVTQVARAIERPNDRIAIIGALARLRSIGSVTREPIEAEVPGAGPKDTHVYKAA